MSKLNSNRPLVSIIILNYNAGELLINCIESVINSNYSNLEIIVVDNNSTDQSHIKCKKKFNDIKIIENKENHGYCEGNNIGIRKKSDCQLFVYNTEIHFLYVIVSGFLFVKNHTFSTVMLILK